MSVYISTAWEQRHRAAHLAAVLNGVGIDTVCQWWAWSEKKSTMRIALDEVAAVVRADSLVVLWPGGRGTHIEIGAALARGVSVYTVGEGPTPPSPFYDHPLIQHFASVDDVVAHLVRDA